MALCIITFRSGRKTSRLFPSIQVARAEADRKLLFDTRVISVVVKGV